MESDETMTIPELEMYLQQNGFPDDSNGDLYQTISCAYDAFVAGGNQDTANCIANAFSTVNEESGSGPEGAETTSH